MAGFYDTEDVIDLDAFFNVKSEKILHRTSIRDLTPIQAEVAFFILAEVKKSGRSCILTITAKEEVSLKIRGTTYWVSPNGELINRHYNSSKYSKPIDMSNPDFVKYL